MSFLFKDDNILDKHNEMWDKIKGDFTPCLFMMKNT